MERARKKQLHRFEPYYNAIARCYQIAENGLDLVRNSFFIDCLEASEQGVRTRYHPNNKHIY